MQLKSTLVNIRTDNAMQYSLNGGSYVLFEDGYKEYTIPFTGDLSTIRFSTTSSNRKSACASLGIDGTPLIFNDVPWLYNPSYFQRHCKHSSQCWRCWQPNGSQWWWLECCSNISNPWSNNITGLGSDLGSDPATRAIVPFNNDLTIGTSNRLEIVTAYGDTTFQFQFNDTAGKM